MHENKKYLIPGGSYSIIQTFFQELLTQCLPATFSQAEPIAMRRMITDQSPYQRNDNAGLQVYPREITVLQAPILIPDKPAERFARDPIVMGHVLTA